ncbi:MAG: hypothetical protein Faunusvirus12_14 [Faunusvirus sp.]|uniref:Uncharacterized protein n=1 Tax=Faunusvirus sp. TaxID=2487766 RepID=A0A3G4ZZH1_9VIRU|nr:MAG: hypothetical protein Faunusvirus12_14 [Faunusvirus sp.]
MCIAWIYIIITLIMDDKLINLNKIFRCAPVDS